MRFNPQTPSDAPLVFATVGLPARGKSYLARRLLRYVSWLGYQTKIFNVGAYRRRLLDGPHEHDFFSPRNAEGNALREKMAVNALEDLKNWIRNGGDVGIYDATNSSRSRRARIVSEAAQVGARVVFVESITDDPELIEKNIADKRAHSPDYVGQPADRAIRDFRLRMAHYEESYETLAEEGLSYIKVIDVGRQVIANRVHGFLSSNAVYFLMNLHLVRRPVLLTRHGESEFNAAGRIGGDSELTDRGEAYARSLRAYLDSEFGDEEVVVWTSTLRRTRRTAELLGRDYTEWRALDEIEAGICNGLTYAEIKERYPEDYQSRSEDKLAYRYPRGESYLDVIERLSALIIEIERQRKPLLIVAHQAVVRVLFAYFTHAPLRQCPFIEVPLHAVMKVTPSSFGCDEEIRYLGESAPESSSS